MAVTVNVKITKNLDVNAPADKAFKSLVDVEGTVALFPKLDSLVELDTDIYRWEMDKIGAAGLSHQVKYAVKYSNDGKSKIQWDPHTEVESNARVSGSWTITQKGPAASHIVFESQGEFDMPLPKLMKGVAEGIVRSEFESQVSTFLDRVKKNLESN